MSLIRKADINKPIYKFEKNKILNDLLNDLKKRYPEWVYLHFPNSIPCDILVIFSSTKTVQIKIKAFMTYETIKEQLVQHIIPIDITDPVKQITNEEKLRWQNKCYKHIIHHDIDTIIRHLEQCAQENNANI